MIPKVLSGVIISLFFTSLIFAQLNEFVITPQPAPEVIPIFTSHPDKAAIIIYSSVADLKFDSNTDGIVKILTDDVSGTYTLIIYPERQFIKVKKRGFLEGLMNIPPTEQRQVLYYKIEQKINTELEYSGVTVKSNPAGAQFTVKGIPGAIYTTPATLKEFRTGTYEFSFSYPGHISLDTTLIVQGSRNNEFSVNLSAAYGFLRITNPVQGEFTINGYRVSDGSYENYRRVDTGSYKITIEHPYYKPFARETIIKPAWPPDSIFIDWTPDPIISELRINSSPSGAEILANGKLLGITPFVGKLNAGEYTLEIRYPSYTTKTLKEIIVNPVYEFNIELQQNSQFRITGTPGTIISVNGKYTGTLPLNLPLEVENGSYSVTGELAGYDPITYNLTVDKEIRDISFEMVKSEGRFVRLIYPGSYRIAELMKNHTLSARSELTNFSRNLFTTASAYPVYFDGSSVMYGGEYRFSWYFLTAKAGYLNGWISTAMKNTFNNDESLFTMTLIKAGIEVHPVLFWEKIIPFIGADFINTRTEFSQIKFASVYNDYEITGQDMKSFSANNISLTAGVGGFLQIFPFLNLNLRAYYSYGLGSDGTTAFGFTTGFSF